MRLLSFLFDPGTMTRSSFFTFAEAVDEDVDDVEDRFPEEDDFEGFLLRSAPATWCDASSDW